MKRSSWALIAAALAVLVAGAWLWFAPRPALPKELLALVPADAAGFLRVRVERVLAGDAYQRLVQARGGAAGVARVEARCGFNPLTQVRELVVFARDVNGAGELRYALVARGPLRHAQLLDCLSRYGRGDTASLTREQVEGVPTVRTRLGSRAAFIGADGLIAGDDESVRAALRSLRGRAPGVNVDPVLAPLARELSAASDLTLVARVPRAWEALVRENLGASGAGAQPVEGVRAVGASVANPPGRIEGRGLVLAQDARQASAITAQLERARGRLLDLPALRVTPLAAPLRALALSTRAERVHVQGAIELDALEALLALLPALERLSQE